MSIVLTIVMCSSMANQCLEPHTFDKVYDDFYTCMDQKMQRLDFKYPVVGYGIFFKVIELLYQNISNFYKQMFLNEYLNITEVIH